MVVIASMGAAALAAWLSARAARGSAEAEGRLSPLTVGLAALLGACACLALPHGTGAALSAVTAALGAFLLAGAVIDRYEGIAPDMVAAPVLILTVVLGASRGQPDIGAWGMVWPALYGAGAYLAINGLWIAIDKVTGGRSLPPPADLTAIALPAVLCGFRPEVTVFYVGCSLVAFLCLRIPRLQAIFTDADVAKELRAEITDDQERHAVAALAILYPALWLLLAASHA